MSSIYFQGKVAINNANNPNQGGFLVAYDEDGILKQKDSDGNVTPIGLAVSNQYEVEDVSSNYNSSSGTWSVSLSYNVVNDDIDLASVYVNGVKTNGILSISGTPSVLVIDQYAYDIDASDILRIKYLRE
jgi:hypothetical protein